MVGGSAANTADPAKAMEGLISMHQHHAGSTAFLRSLADTFGEVQIVAAPNRVVLDLQALNYDTAGFLHRDYALASLSVGAAVQLRDLLSAAIVAAADMPPVQPGIWSNAAHTGGSRRVGRRAS